MPTLSIHRPSIFTKELKLQPNRSSGERWLRISSNLLPVMGFARDTRFTRTVLAPGAGFEFRAADAGPTKVYTRKYHRRRNNPTEAVIDYKGQDFLNAALPAFAERVHLTFTPGVIVGRPVTERTFHIRRAIRQPQTPLEAFVGMSAGIDSHHIAKAGFALQGLLEYRPQEKRDHVDLTETGIVTALRNSAHRVVINEDIFRVDFARIAELLKDQPPIALLAISPCCDDFTAGLKSAAVKAAHVESLETTVDQCYELLRLVETTKPASILVENVMGFASSSAGQLIALKLRRWGYHVCTGVYDSRNYGGATSRRRFLLVASVFPGFEPPKPCARMQPGSIWPLIEDQIPLCNDASHTSSLRKGIATGRACWITPESACAPTIVKSQGRHAADAIYIAAGDRTVFPNETILRRLQGIPADFSFEAVGSEIATEQIGSSVCGAMHSAFCRAIMEHLRLQRSQGPDAHGQLSLGI